MQNKRKQKKQMKRKAKVTKQKQYLIENKNKRVYKLLVKTEDGWSSPSQINKKIKDIDYFRTLNEVRSYLNELEEIRKLPESEISEGKIIQIDTGEEIVHIKPKEIDNTQTLSDAKDVIKT